MDFSGFDRPLPGSRQAKMGGFQTAPAPQKKKGRGGTLSSLISEAGGTGGALGGAAIGTALLPGIGTLLGAGIGGALGGFGGRVAENKIRDDRIGLSDALKEGAVSGVFGAGPLRLLKGAGAATKAGLTGGGLAGALSSGSAAATAPSAIKTALAGKLNTVSENQTSKALGLTKGQKNSIREKTGESPGAIAKRYGVKQAGDVKAAVQPLYKEFDEIIDTIPQQFTPTDVASKFKAVYEPMLAKGQPLGTQKMGQSLKDEADNLVSGLSGAVSPRDINKARQSFDKLAYKMKASDPGMADINKQARDVLSGMINEAAEKAGVKSAAGRTVREVGQEINKLERVGKAAKKNIEGAGGSMQLGLGSVPGAVIGVGGGPAGAAAGYAANMALNSGAGRRATSAVVDKLSSNLTKSAAKPFGLKSTATRVGVTGSLANSLINGGGSVEAASMDQPSDSDMSQQMVTNTTMPNNSMNPLSQALSESTMDMPQTDPNDPFSPDDMQANVQKLLAGGANMDSIKEYIGMVSAMQEIKEAQNATAKPLSAAAQKQVSTADAGLSSLNQIESIINKSGVPKGTVVSGRGMLGGLGQNLLGTSSYDAAADNVADTMVRMRTGAAATKDELALYRRLLPQAFDSPQVQRQKLDAVRNYMMSLSSGTQQTTPAGDLDELMAGSAF